MYSLIQQILGFVYYFVSMFEIGENFGTVDGGILSWLLQLYISSQDGNVDGFGIISAQYGELFFTIARYEAIATLVISVLVVWLICKLICRIFDC